MFDQPLVIGNPQSHPIPRIRGCRVLCGVKRAAVDIEMRSSSDQAHLRAITRGPRCLGSRC